MWFPFWSYTLAFEACVCMIGFSVRMSLYGLQYCMVILRSVIFSGGCINILSFVRA